MESGDEKRGGSTFSNPPILKFNSLIINVLIFLLTVILAIVNKNISGYVRTIAKVISNQLDTFAFELHQNFIIDSVVINSQKETSIVRVDSLIKVKISNPVNQNNLVDGLIYYHGTAPSLSGALGDGFSNGTSPSRGNQVTWSLSETRGTYHWLILPHLLIKNLFYPPCINRYNCYKNSLLSKITVNKKIKTLIINELSFKF